MYFISSLFNYGFFQQIFHLQFFGQRKIPDIINKIAECNIHAEGSLNSPRFGLAQRSAQRGDLKAPHPRPLSLKRRGERVVTLSEARN
jgi:hypothetical protein